ncbi:tripartite tricarboxylate transporter TctB family protein [Bradyrhizobium sp. Leo170]|uniref:tripartite tricarboxylate transporter TctB family protein n=1 Tax=Bradyrhizobium sp. Leo170 TaxID=1571199 RepID=UPI00102E5C02|nr:tripartite tricarboxylate transporter TctB family protein [Bradyrhizobium sp. Leo170]
MNRDVIAGLLVLAIGIVTLLLVARLPADAGGTAGAAYLPGLIAYGVLATGAFIGAQGLRAPVKMTAWSWRPLSALILGVLTFGLLIEHAGLVLASGCCAFIGSLAAPFPGWKQRCATIIIICALAVLIFKYLLGLNISVWPTWIS